MRDKCRSLSFITIAAILACMVNSSWAQTANKQTAPDKLIAVIPYDSPPTYFLDKKTGRPAGFAVDIMDKVAEHAGFHVDYITAGSWTQIIGKIQNGEADLSPGVSISEEREKLLAFSSPIDAFPVSFFARSNSSELDVSKGRHTVGVVLGSVAYEDLKTRPNLLLVSYQSFQSGLFDLLAGHLDAFACPAPTLLQLARETGVEDKIRIVGKPIAEIKRAIALRKDNIQLLEKINGALESFVGQPEYQRIYVKWYGKPKPYWTPYRIIAVCAFFVFIIMCATLVLRYITIVRFNRELKQARNDLEKAHDELELKIDKRTFELGIANEELEQEIAERKRVEESLKSRLLMSEYANTHTLDEVLQATLDEAERISRSQIGFFHFLEPDQMTLSLQSWSTATLSQCTAAGKGEHYPVSQAGVWVDCIRERRPIIHNNYTSLPHKRGTPQGHVPVIRELVVPIFQGELIVAVIGVGNKQTDYSPEDINYVTQLATLAWDIVQRKRAEKALRENEKFLQTIIETEPECIKVLAADGTLVQMNRAGLSMIGADSLAQVKGQCVYALVADEHREAFKSLTEGVFQGKSGVLEFEAIGLKGIHIWLETHAVPLRNDRDEIIALLGITRDVTERKKTEVALTSKQHQLEELNATLEQRVQEEIASRQEKEQLLFQQSRMAAMGEMIGAIAHQWRQPLNVIGLIVQNLQMAYEYGELSKERFRNAVGTAMWQINFMSKTIDDFRNFFKPSRQKEVFDVRKVVDETISLMKAQLQNNYIDVEIIAEKESLDINGYPNEFKHVLLNLINNAKDAILLRKTKENCQARITIEISETDNRTILKIRDTGGGIQEDIMDKIFDPYFTTKGEGTGTGIGLYISKTMLERNMGGQLTARNWKEGAEFRIEV